MPKNFFAVVSLLAVLTLTLLGCGGGGGGNGPSGGTVTTIDLTGGDGSATLPSGVSVLAEGPSGGELKITESTAPELNLGGIQGLRQLELAYNGPSGSVAIGLAAPKTLATGNVNPESLFFLEQDGSNWRLMRGGIAENGGFAKQFYTSTGSKVATAFLRSVSSTDERETMAVVGGRLVLAGISDELFSLDPGDPNPGRRPGLKKRHDGDGSPLSVVFIHGLNSYPGIWDEFHEFAGQDGGYYEDRVDSWIFGYSSYQRIAVSAEELNQALIAAYAGSDFDRLVLVGHSMGGLVARTAVLLASEDGERWPEALERVYLIGTPNYGSPVAALYSLVEAWLGLTSTGQDYGPMRISPAAPGVIDLQIDSEFLQIINSYSANMPVITIAGNKPSVFPYSLGAPFFLTVPNDGLVSVQSARASDLFRSFVEKEFADNHGGLILPFENGGTGDDVEYLQWSIASQASAFSFKATLAWDTDNTDVDLHLWDPFGRHTYFGEMEIGAAWLDFDDLFGYGPENITVYKPAISGRYAIAVNYYNDRDIYNTGVEVRVLASPGTELETTGIFSHALSYSDGMVLPVSEGPSWWRPCDIYVDASGVAVIRSPDLSRQLEFFGGEGVVAKPSGVEGSTDLRARLGL